VRTGMDALKALKLQVQLKKAEKQELVGAKKYVRKSELEEARLKRLREEEEAERRAKVCLLLLLMAPDSSCMGPACQSAPVLELMCPPCLYTNHHATPAHPLTAPHPTRRSRSASASRAGAQPQMAGPRHPWMQLMGQQLMGQQQVQPQQRAQGVQQSQQPQQQAGPRPRRLLQQRPRPPCLVRR
jgi:hypothetical protein